MADIKFYLDFISNGEGKLLIDEPIGFDAAEFVSKQKSKGLARSISFGGGETEFSFYRMRNHYLDKLLYYKATFGWESQVQLIIEIDGIDNIIGDLDFFKATTDQLEYLKCNVIQDSNEAILERRKDINVNVFSDKDIDDDSITPLITENVLVKAKPISQSSSWETPEVYNQTVYSSSGAIFTRKTVYFALNPSINLKKYDIQDSLTFFSPIETESQYFENFKIIQALDNLRNIEVNINNLDLLLSTFSTDGGDGYLDSRFVIKYGNTFNDAQSQDLFNVTLLDSDVDYTNKNDYSFKIPSLSRGESVWLYFDGKLRQSANSTNVNASMNVEVTINSMDVNVSASSISYNTIVPSIRLKDGVSQVVKSTSKLSTSFPFAEPNGEMYNQRIFSGNLLRNLTDRAFNISLKDIESWLPEIYGDYEVNGDSVFFGKYDDYYQNKEIGVFEDVLFDDYQKSFNERYAINNFGFKYKKYQSQKENEVENTFDIVHGKSQWSVLNRFVENKKDAQVGFVRCSFYMDEQRRKALNITETTSTQDDDTIFILDSKESEQDLTFQETDYLLHTYDEDTGYLKLSNTGNFNFSLLGIAVGEQFSIQGNDLNLGTYTIIEITDRFITLNNGSGSIANNGDRSTQFEYIVSTNTAPFISWSDEGFNYINNTFDPENFANLKYTIKRNIINFYNSYLATCNLYVSAPIKSTLYTNNKELELGYNGVQSKEGEEFTPTNPILSPYKHEITLITDFLTYKSIENKVKTDRGYIRTFDANGHVIKVYPQEMTYKNSAKLGELKIIGEEKYEQSLINITYGGLGYVSINDEYRTPNIKYRVEDEQIFILDEQERLLYNPVYWQKVSVNDAVPKTKTELLEWLSLIS